MRLPLRVYIGYSGIGVFGYAPGSWRIAVGQGCRVKRSGFGTYDSWVLGPRSYECLWSDETGAGLPPRCSA